MHAVFMRVLKRKASERLMQRDWHAMDWMRCSIGLLLLFMFIYLLFYSGTEGSGIVGSHGDVTKPFVIHKGMGLVREIYNDQVLDGFNGENWNNK
jgi:hypothetical protein